MIGLLVHKNFNTYKIFLHSFGMKAIDGGEKRWHETCIIYREQRREGYRWER